MAEESIRFRITDDGKLVYTAVSGTEEEQREAMEELEKIAREAAAEPERNEEVSWFFKAVRAIVLGVVFGTTIGQIPAVQQVYNYATDIERRTRPIVDRYNKEARRIRGLIDRAEIQHIINTARVINRVGLIVSDRYRSHIEKFYEITSTVSQRVFGDAALLNGSLNLLRLAIQDVTRLKGDSIDIGDREFFSHSTALLDDVEVNASRYARRPDRFWYDFNHKYLNPQLEQAAAAEGERHTLINLLGDGIRLADTAAEQLDDRFKEYRESVDPFLSPIRQYKLDRMITDYHTRVRTPIYRLTAIANNIIPAIRNATVDNAEDLVVLEARVGDQEDLTASPSTLSEPKQIVQGNRFDDILGELFTPGDFTDKTIEDAQMRYDKILERLEVRGRYVD